MTDINLGRYRGTPLHAPEANPLQPETSSQNNAVQRDEAVQLHTPAPHVSLKKEEVSAPGDYTISVEQVRDHLRQKGLIKSKDTIQRWCRTGDLDCRKMGLLNRFFTTEASLKTLEEKLLPDLIADQVGSMQSHEGAGSSASTSMQIGAAEQDAEDSKMHLHEDVSEGARSGVQADQATPAPAPNGVQHVSVSASVEVAELRAKVEGLKSQLEQAQEITKFLKDEIISARGQRGDVVKIAEQMLGTLETIATGGRLEKPAKTTVAPSPEAVRYQPAPRDADTV